MSSLKAAYTFNDNVGSSIYDYSSNNITLTPSAGSMTLSATTSPAGVGYDCLMNKTCTGTLFRPMGAYTGLTAFMYVKYNGSTGTFITNTNSFSVAINSSGNIIFVTKDGSTHTLTSQVALTSGTWNTVTCTWNDDGAVRMLIFINGVQDPNTLTGATTLNNTAGSLVMGIVGSSPNYSLVNTLEVRNTAFNIAQVFQLEANPGGAYYQSLNQFAVGDVIADEDQVNQAIVTYVADNSGFYAYPLTSNAGGDYLRYGNVYNANRQYFFQFTKDFDGNGNGQMNIMWPITNFLDYAAPVNTQKVDFTGITMPAGAWIKGQSGTQSIIDMTDGALQISDSGGNSLFFKGTGLFGTREMWLSSTNGKFYFIEGSNGFHLDLNLLTNNTLDLQVPNKSGTETIACLSDISGFGSGTVTSITAGTGLTGGTITTSGTIALATALPNGQTATTQASGSNDTRVATDAYVDAIRYQDPSVIAYQALGSSVKAQAVGLSIPLITTSASQPNQTLLFIPVYLPYAQTITGVKWYQAAKGNYTANNYNGVGLYSYSAGTLTLVASSTNDGTIWQTAASGTFGSKAFNGTYAAAAGIYYIALLYCESAHVALPTLGASPAQAAAAQGLDFTNGAFLYCAVAGQTALPSPTIAINTTTAGANCRWAAIY